MTARAAAVAEVVNDKAVAKQSILRKSMVLTMHFHYLGNNRAVDLEDVVDQAGGTLTIDPEQYHLTKKLIDPKEIRPVTRIQSQMAQYVRSKAVPTSRVFGTSSFLVPSSEAVEIDQTLTKKDAELRIAAHQFAFERYLPAVERQRVALKEQFKAGDYLKPEEVERRFGVEWHFVSFDLPDNLETVSTALFNREKDRNEARFARAYDEVKLVLRGALLQIVAEIGKKLAPDSDGKEKVFRNSILNDLIAFIGTFNVRNLADDSDLESVVKRLQRLSDGLDPDAIRKVDSVREHVTAEISKATKQLDGLVVKARRAMDLDL